MPQRKFHIIHAFLPAETQYGQVAGEEINWDGSGRIGMDGNSQNDCKLAGRAEIWQGKRVLPGAG
jgi:hypothetical protein